MNESNCKNKGAACFLVRWTEQQHKLQKLTDDGTSNFIHPLALAATALDTEVSYFKEAIQEPDRDKFVIAMMKEIEDLNKAQVWEIEEQDKSGETRK